MVGGLVEMVFTGIRLHPRGSISMRDRCVNVSGLSVKKP